MRSLPTASDWRSFLDRLLLWSGAAALAAAVIFFIAHNWSGLGRLAKFGLVELLVLAAVLGYWRLGPDRAGGKAALLVAAIALGGVLALFGQTYQTGADTWELFANWAVLILPWVLVGRFAALWMSWLLIANVALLLYGGRELWTLFAFNSAALAVWELAARRFPWLEERWAPRLLALAAGTIITVLMLEAIFDRRGTGVAMAVVLYPLFLAALYAVYRRLKPDLFMLAAGCLSLIVVATGFLGRQLFAHSSEAAAFLLVGIAVIAMAGAAGWWLRQVSA